jgi:hypothetical protein
MLKKLFTVAAAAALSLTPALAAPFDGGLTVEGGGTPVVFETTAGDYIALLGLRGAEAGDTLDLASVLGLTTQGSSRISDILVGNNNDAFLGDPAVFTSIGGGADIDELDNLSGRVFDAFFVRFTGTERLVFSNGNGGTTTLSFNAMGLDVVNVDGAVPVPAAALLFAPIAGAVVARRRRKA